MTMFDCTFAVGPPARCEHAASAGPSDPIRTEPTMPPEQEALIRAEADIKAAIAYVEARENQPALGLRQTLEKIQRVLAAKPASSSLELGK
ncbi:hypothetical protein AC629_13595 [Bradyrhizobium sp. NAS80.1]|nr:hypothetical protein AC629_13595 [Bradyrhizobium sp. NAS80.1]